MLGRFGRFMRSNAIALIALFFALGGAASAALPGTNTVDSGDIIDNAVKSVDIRGAAVGPSDLAPSVRPRWARVNGDFSVERSRGLATSNPVTDAGTGAYNVNFANALMSCGYTATLNIGDDETPAAVPGEISVARVDADTLRVFTMSSGPFMMRPSWWSGSSTTPFATDASPVRIETIE
jgi:hypothetical protein